MTDFQIGEFVDISIKGARVVDVTRHGDGNGDDLRFHYEAKDGEAWPSAVWADAPGVSITRVAPAEWPPVPGDLWRDRRGDLWWTRSYSSSSPLNRSARDEDNSQLLKEHGPLTLVHREQQDGGAA